MQNPDIARLFDEVADLLEIQDANPFRVRAYRNAARTIRDFPESLADLVRAGTKDLTEIPGIGEDLAEKIAEIVATGELKLHRQLAAKLPSGLLDLLRIPGLGPKRVKLLHKKLKVKSAADLARALDAGKVQKLKGFGPKMEEKMRAGLGQAQATERRLLLHEAETQANAIVAYLKSGGGIHEIEVAGSYRRRRETIGDLDVLVTCTDSAKVMDRFVGYPEVREVLSQGETRATVKLRGGLQVDLRAVEPDAYGAALLYFTGSKAHNIDLRKIAQEKSYKLNEYGLFKGTRRAAGKTEEEVYAKLGLDWIPPELREARGEIALAREPRLHHPPERRARHPREWKARPARRRAGRRGLRRGHHPLRAQSGREGADPPPRGRCGTPVGRRDRTPDRAPRGQARAVRLRFRGAVSRLRGAGVPARAERPPRADGPAGHARGGRQTARRPVRALDGQPPAGEPVVHEVRRLSGETRGTGGR